MYCILTRFCTELRLPTCIKELMMMMMTWRIQLNRPCAAAMRPYVQLL